MILNQKSLEINWLCEIAENDDLWIDDITRWPSVVAYEYKNLRKLCSEKKPYGVLLCLKDNFETILKLETLLAYAWAEQNTNDSFRINTISQITTPNLSLGGWKNLAKDLVEAIQKTDIKLPDNLPLEKLYAKFDKLGIVVWRNEKLGHGAMVLEDDEEFRRDILKQLNNLKEILNMLCDDLISQKLYSGGTCLEGPGLARGLSVDGEVTCSLLENGLSFSVDPYIVIRKHEKRGKGVYFFDNQKSKTRTDFQAYSDGSRKKENVAHFEKLRRELDKKKVDFAASPNDIYLDEIESRELDLLQMSHDFVEPNHLIAWLRGCVEKHEKGVFHLQMDRGMGKSVFTEHLDRLYKNPIEIDDYTDVRTYHFYRTNSAGDDDFRSRIEWKWANQYKGSFSWQKIPRISDYERKGFGSAEAFCEFLKTVREYSARNRHKTRIMMVLDGLDEIMQDELLDIIPDSDILPEGVYILVTSRNLYEPGISVKLADMVSRIQVREKIEFTSESKENEQFLRAYIKNTGLKGITEEQFSILLKQSEYRVLYLGMLCMLAEHGICIEELPNKEKVVEIYLATIDECYGEIGSIRIREVLTVLSILGMMEPLPLKVIGGLTAEGRLTLGLIGMIRDLSPMLKVFRSPECNLYSIANPDLAEELKAQLPEIEDTIRLLIEYGLDQIKTGYPLELSETEPVIAHISELAKMLSDDMTDLGKDFSAWMEEFIAKAEKDVKYAIERKRVCNYREQQLVYLMKQYGEEHPDTWRCMIMLVISYHKMGHYTEATRLAEKVVELSNKILGQKHPDTWRCMSLLVICYRDIGQYEKAAEISIKILDLQKKILGQEHPDTYTSSELLASCYREMRQYEKAAELEEKVLDAGKKVLGNNNQSIMNNMSGLAMDYSKLGQYEKAIGLHEQTIEMSKKVLGEDHPKTLTYMSNHASCYREMGQYKKAAELNKKVLYTRKKILGNDHPDTITSVNELAICYMCVGQFAEAAELLKQGIEILRKAVGEDHPKTLTSMSNLASCYQEMRQYEKAAELEEKVLDARKKMLGNDHPSILNNMSNLALDYSKLGHYEKAISLYEQTIEISKKVLGEDNPKTLTYMIKLVDCFKATGQSKKAAGLQGTISAVLIFQKLKTQKDKQ